MRKNILHNEINEEDLVPIDFSRPIVRKSFGLTIKEVKHIFREKTHIGKCWNVKPSYNIFTGNVTIEMYGSEKLVYNMRTGMGKRYDWDDDGCSITDDFEFRIGNSPTTGELTILRTKNYGDTLERMK